MPPSRLTELHPMHAFGVVSGIAKQVRVTRLEERTMPLVPFPHKHAFHQMLIVTAGKGWHEVDFERHAVRPGRVFAMRPVQVHSWQLAKGTRGFVVEFADEAAPPGAAELPLPVDLDGEDWTNVTQLAALMLGEYERRARDFEAVLRACLSTLLLVIARAAPEEARQKAPPSDVVGRFEALVEASFRERHDVAFYARKLGLGAKALTMRVTRATGRSARAAIQERCLLEGKRLLAYSDLPISRIAFELGFDDPGYFARLFRRKTGDSPGRFRAAARSLS